MSARFCSRCTTGGKHVAWTRLLQSRNKPAVTTEEKPAQWKKKSMLKMWDEKKKEAQHCTCQVAYFWKQIRIRTKICKCENFLFVSTQSFSARFLRINTCRKPAFHEPHRVHFRFLTVFLKLSAVLAGFLPMQAVQQDTSCPGPELWPPGTTHQSPATTGRSQPVLAVPAPGKPPETPLLRNLQS